MVSSEHRNREEAKKAISRNKKELEMTNPHRNTNRDFQ